MANVRFHIIFTGRVQGVGFRATTQEVAERAGVTGWVRNLMDGSVECVAEGPQPSVNAFLDRLSREMSRYVESRQVDRETATGEFPSFTVRA